MSTTTVTEAGMGRRPTGKAFKIKIGDADLDFRFIELTDPVPTGRQIIKAGGFSPADEFLIFEASAERCLTEIKLDETVDLRGPGSERFIIFKSDRSWRGVLDDMRFEWGAREISGRTLKWLAGVDADTHGVWLERRDEPDLLIGDDETARLTPKGVERFRTGPLIRVCIEDAFFPWDSRTINMEEIAGLGGWDPSEGVIEVDKDQNERTLEPGEVVKLRHGLAFGKKFCFKRGAR